MVFSKIDFAFQDFKFFFYRTRENVVASVFLSDCIEQKYTPGGKSPELNMVVCMPGRIVRVSIEKTLLPEISTIFIDIIPSFCNQ